jgi:hypothetical protein
VRRRFAVRSIHRAPAAEKAALSKVRPDLISDPRLIAVADLILAIDSRDHAAAVAIQRRLRGLGLSVVPIGPVGQGGRR